MSATPIGDPPRDQEAIRARPKRSKELFIPPLIITNGGPLNATLSIIQLLYRRAFVELEFGYGSAMATLLLPLLALLSLLNRKVSDWIAHVVPLFVLFNEYHLMNTYAGIMLPGLVSALSVFTFTQAWDDLLWPMVIAPHPDMHTLQVGLAFIRQTALTPNQVMAAIVIASVPVVGAFLLGQRYFIAGITAGAVRE